MTFPVDPPQSPTFTNVTEAYAWLNGRIDYEKLLGTVAYGEKTFALDGFRERMTRLGDPQRGLKTIHIAGTRGKGSTALLLEALLTSQGARVATFTSPHFREYRERIRIGGEWLSGNDFARLLKRSASLPSIESENRHGFQTVFEHLTAIYFLAAREAEADWSVVETGLGGRLDCTNILDPGTVVLTRIGLEHTRLLGDTITAIAGEKAAILKPGGWGVVGAQDSGGDATRVFESRSRETSAPLISAESVCPLLESRFHPEGMRLVYQFRGEPLELDLPLLGPFAAENLQNALAAFDQLAERNLIAPPDHDSMIRALTQAHLPGRMEISARDLRLIADAAHCPTAARALASAMRAHFPNSRAIAVVGMASDKDHDGFFTGLAEWDGWQGVICYTLNSPRAMDAELLAQRAKPHFASVEIRPTLREALDLANSQIGHYDKLCAVGSAYGVAEALEWESSHAPESHAHQNRAQIEPHPSDGNP